MRPIVVLGVVLLGALLARVVTSAMKVGICVAIAVWIVVAVRRIASQL
jgi:hypothetical protein